MFEKASSSQTPSANMRLFGSSLSVDCQSVFLLRTSFPSGFEKWNVFFPEQHAFYFIIQLQCIICYNRWHDTEKMAGLAIFVRKSILHLIKESGSRNSYSLLVMIDWTGTYIITYILFGMKKGETWVTRQVWKLPKGGVATPSTLPPGSASVVSADESLCLQ